MNFLPQQYSRLKSRLRTKYSTKLKHHSKVIKGFARTPFGTWFLNHKDEMHEYSPLKWYFLSQVDIYIFFFEHKIPLYTQEQFSPEEDLVFEKWNQSEFADEFLKMLNAGMSVTKASNKTFKIFERHLIGLGERHILKTNRSNVFYRFQPSLGEFKNKNAISKLLETTLHLEGKELNLMTSSLKEMKHFSHRIEIALRVIKKISPTSYERFQAFTEAIIPIRDEEFVSFSHQELPGTSMINMYNRDFVDLMDDLIHENGHHHLNHYLNLQTLIKEPIDNIYYSPWRRTLRPLRGVYHAYFTFYWAFKLFSDLASSKEMDSIFYLFSASEKEKIYFRAVEEFHMLYFTYQELKWAKKNKLISDSGWDLISEQQKEISKFKSKVVIWEKKLKSHKKEMTLLKKTLIQAKKKYLKHSKVI